MRPQHQGPPFLGGAGRAPCSFHASCPPLHHGETGAGGMGDSHSAPHRARGHSLIGYDAEHETVSDKTTSHVSIPDAKVARAPHFQHSERKRNCNSYILWESSFPPSAGEYLLWLGDTISTTHTATVSTEVKPTEKQSPNIGSRCHPGIRHQL